MKIRTFVIDHTPPASTDVPDDPLDDLAATEMDPAESGPMV